MARKKTTKKATSKKVEDQVEETSTDQIEAVEETPKKETKKLYWQTRVHLTAFGIVQGEVVPEHLAAFKAKVPKDTDMSKWVGDSDPIEAQKRERIAIAKARREGKIIV